MAETDFRSIWERAVDKYDQQTHRKLVDDVTFREFETLEDFGRAIDERGLDFEHFRERHRKPLSSMMACFRPLIPILDAGKNPLGSTPFAPASVAFGAASHLLKTCESVSRCYDEIEDVFKKIGDFTVRLAKYGECPMDTSLRVRIANILAAILVIMGRVERIIRRKRFRFWGSLLLQDDQIKASMMQLQDGFESELGLVAASTYADVRKLQISNEFVRGQLGQLVLYPASDREMFIRNWKRRRFEEVLDSPSTLEVDRKYARHVESLAKNTGLWITREPSYQAWQQGAFPLLWIFGPPAVGKTMLASRTIELLKSQLLRQSDLDTTTSVSYLYFQNGNPDLQDCAQSLNTTAIQAARTDDEFKNHVLNVIETNNECFAHARHTWKALFLDFFTREPSSKCRKNAFVIIDGLDEAPMAERQKMLSCLADLVESCSIGANSRIRVAVFSRPDVREDPGFERIDCSRMKTIFVTPDRTSADIDSFIRQNLRSVQLLNTLQKHRPRALYERLAWQIYNTVQDRSYGMFLWASLAFDQIRAAGSPWKRYRPSCSRHHRDFTTCFIKLS